MPVKFKISWRGRPYIGFFPPSLKSLFQKKYGKCPECGHYLVLRKGKYGKFIGCSNYPRCRYTQRIWGIK